MPKIILQAGHLNIKNNCDVSLRGSTGAGGEVQVNQAIRDATALLLEDNGIEVKKVDANYNCDDTSADTDWDLFLAIHCDMDYANDNGSGFCDYPEPSTDGATEESQRLAKEIQNSFFPAVGINIKSRSNANTRYYYMWEHLSAKTPCVLIEMGQVKDPHDSIILLDTPRTAEALANAILYGLGVKNACTDQIEGLEKELEAMRESRNKWRTSYKDLEAIYTKELKSKTEQIEALLREITKLNEKIVMLEKAVQENKTPLSMYGRWEKFLSIFG